MTKLPALAGDPTMNRAALSADQTPSSRTLALTVPLDDKVTGAVYLIAFCDIPFEDLVP